MTALKRIFVVAFSGLFFSAQAQEVREPILLVATPELHGPYRETALIALRAEQGHFGFILNRPTAVRLSTLFPEHPPSAKVIEPVYFGGPEASAVIFAVLRSDPGPSSMHLLDDIYLTGKASNIDRIIERTPNDARYFVGFVLWKPGELADEVERGFWLIRRPDASLLFDKDTSSMWARLILRTDGPLTPAMHWDPESTRGRIAHTSVHAGAFGEDQGRHGSGAPLQARSSRPQKP
jgi:putative AlgH/UPF0301 family transcriptional regulator